MCASSARSSIEFIVSQAAFQAMRFQAIIKAMRSLFLLIPALALLAQAQAPKSKMAPAPKPAAMKNFKEFGSPNAPLTLEVYSDYMCPHCREFDLVVIPEVMTNYVNTGKVRLIHRDFPLPNHQYSKLAAKYANAAGELGHYDIVVTQIFKTQAQWDQNGNIDAEVMKVVPPGDMQKIREMVRNDPHLDDTVNSDMALANQDGLNQTPTLIIVSHGKRNKIDGGVEYLILKSYLDQLLAKN